jgi:hypothetical protein
MLQALKATWCAAACCLRPGPAEACSPGPLYCVTAVCQQCCSGCASWYWNVRGALLDCWPAKIPNCERRHAPASVQVAVLRAAAQQPVPRRGGCACLL